MTNKSPTEDQHMTRQRINRQTGLTNHQQIAQQGPNTNFGHKRSTRDQQGLKQTTNKSPTNYQQWTNTGRTSDKRTQPTSRSASYDSAESNLSLITIDQQGLKQTDDQQWTNTKATQDQHKRMTRTNSGPTENPQITSK